MKKEKQRQHNDRYQQDIITYYSESGMDYEPWSRRYNMHFGYYKLGLSFFNREKLLDEMNRQVINRLNLDDSASNNIIDLGCGVGASARYAVENFAYVNVLGITIVPWQIEKANKLTEDKLYKDRLNFELMDYSALSLDDNSFDGAYAMESSCYDYGKDKRNFLREAFRVLKPGSRLVVTDGFTKGSKHTSLFNYLYRKVCDGWALQDFAGVDQFVAAMQEIGYEDIQIQDASWRVAPSVMYVPWVSVKYFFKTILFKNPGDKIKIGHFIAPMYGLLMGLHRRQYGYYIISARKPAKA